MKKLAVLLLLLAGCTPVRYVNVESRHNYYERHRHNTYTIPVFVPGRGVILQTRIAPPVKRKDQRPSRKH